MSAEKKEEEAWFQAVMTAGTAEHYLDPALYDYEYRARRRDLHWYRGLAREAAATLPAGETLRVLELGCGSGRLLVPLLRDGHAVCGVDRARAMLRACQGRMARIGEARRRRAVLLQGDFRALPLSPPFPLILCPFNAFMHLYERQDVEACLAEVRRLLAPGGLFALDVLNPDVAWLSRDPSRRWSATKFHHPVTGEHLVYSTNHIYDSVRQVALVRIFYDPVQDVHAPVPPKRGARVPIPRSRLVHLAQRQFFPAELEALLHYNGFVIERRCGGFDGEALDHHSLEQVICARVR